jgi:hypothetical protein
LAFLGFSPKGELGPAYSHVLFWFKAIKNSKSAREPAMIRPKRGSVWPFVLVCLLFIGFGIYNVVRGIDAAESGRLVPGGSRTGPMGGTTAILIGAGSMLAGGLGVWLFASRGRRR